MSISVIIPVYKNVEMFLGHLRHNMQFLKNYEIIVVDDGSHEGVKEKVHKEFPSIIVLEHEKNSGFGPAVNTGVHQATGDYLLFLNSDVRMMKALPQNVLEKFHKDKKLFAISFRQRERDGRDVGKNIFIFKNGFPMHAAATDLKEGLNGWAECGSCIIRKDYFNQLGGFNELLSPAYWEDNDLSYRAYSRGWHVFFDPMLYVEHHHESTTSKYFSRAFLTRAAYAHQFLFTWSNITDSHLWRQHLALLPKNLMAALFRGDLQFLQGFFSALFRAQSVNQLRLRKSSYQTRTDQEIFDLFKDKSE